MSFNRKKVGLFFAFLIAVCASMKTQKMSDIAGGEEEEAHVKNQRANKDVSDMFQSSEVETLLPVQVDLSGMMGMMVENFKVLEKNITAFQSQVEGRLGQVEERQDQVEEKLEGSWHDKRNTSEPSKIHHGLHFGGVYANLTPNETAYVEERTGLPWKSLLGGCLNSSSELNGWHLIQLRDVKRAGNSFQNMVTDPVLDQWDDYFKEYVSPTYEDVAYWRGLENLHEMIYSSDDEFTSLIRSWDVVLAYHCEGVVRCTRYAEFSAWKNSDFETKVSFGYEVYNEGMNSNLLDQYNQQEFSTMKKKQKKMGGHY